MIDYNEIKQFIDKQGPNTKVYIGVDSERFVKNKEPHAKFHKVIVVHINGNNGGKVFGETIVERDYDVKSKPSYRLMTEVYKASELYLEFVEHFPDIEVEVHLDLNPNEKYKSNKVVQQAVGYVKASCGVNPILKPAAWAGSHVADHFPKIERH